MERKSDCQKQSGVVATVGIRWKREESIISQKVIVRGFILSPRITSGCRKIWKSVAFGTQRLLVRIQSPAQGQERFESAISLRCQSKLRNND